MRPVKLYILHVPRSIAGLNSRRIILSVWLLSLAATASADVFNMPTGQTSLQFVTVGDPGNAPDTVVPKNFGTGGYGSVNYVYQMGKYDVTAGQYTQFLNAVAANDIYGLWVSNMLQTPYKVGIHQIGVSGSYHYTIEAGYENFPVNYISWGDATRFCNWLQNGQPIGAEVAGITETGSYALNGAHDHATLTSVVRSPGARYYIPTENEWYKAAYYKGGGTNSGYWSYATQSDIAPINTLPDTGNHANFHDTLGTGNGGLTDAVHYFTDVGAFKLSPSPYGTFDQSGNVQQWTDTTYIDPPSGYVTRVLRGGALTDPVENLASNLRRLDGSEYSTTVGGFRIVSIVPEPETFVLAILALGIVAAGRRWL